MEIKRDKYLSELKSMMHKDFVKIVTGIRRCGKSYLLFKLFSDYLSDEGIDPEHIIKIRLDSFVNRNLRDPQALYQRIESSLTDNRIHYVLLDEIQLVNDFAEVLIEFLGRDNVDLYVTGSNAKLLSKDVITEFRGRGHEIKMYPLSFSEYMTAFPGTEAKGLDQYMTYGGLPQIFDYKTDAEKATFLKNIFEETYMRDIVERYEVRKKDDFNELISILASNIGGLTNPNKLANTFKSVKKSDIGNETIARYISILEDAFIIEKATRYDIKGKQYVDTPFKYYFSDLGLRNARLNFRQTEKTHLMENLIYNELLYRGFNVDVGIVPIRSTDAEGKVKRSQLEVDFICNRGSQRYYLQSAYSLLSDEKAKQESASLININDSFKKLIITNDETGIHRDENGIATVNLTDFLLSPNSLDW